MVDADNKRRVVSIRIHLGESQHGIFEFEGFGA